MPSILPASSPASSTDLAIFTPPPLPRPPAWICALTTTPFAPELKSSLAPASASSREVAIVPRGTVTPYFLRIPFPWYSWIFINGLFQLNDRQEYACGFSAAANLSFYRGAKDLGKP